MKIITQSQPLNADDIIKNFFWNKMREWRKALSSAVDACREMIRRESLVGEEVMKMGTIGKLAEMCPKCYGPPVTGKQEDEPDYILCMDGNFQHRRHLKASVELTDKLKNPSLFIQPSKVSAMKELMEILDTRNLEGTVSFILNIANKKHCFIEDIIQQFRTGALSSTLLPMIPETVEPGRNVTILEFLV
jgi:hypothetical protein